MNKNTNEIIQNKFKDISNQELLEEYMNRITRGELSKDELILAMIKVK